MATGCAQCTAEGGDGGAETMATQADGGGLSFLKETGTPPYLHPETGDVLYL